MTASIREPMGGMAVIWTTAVMNVANDERMPTSIGLLFKAEVKIAQAIFRSIKRCGSHNSVWLSWIQTAKNVCQDVHFSHEVSF
jgi:hypothetical protein